MFVIDIDGTLANAEHRLHLIKQEPKDWDKFLDPKMVDRDQPIWPIIRITNSLYQQGAHICLCSGRNETTRASTTLWLSKYFVSYHALLMRPKNDRRADYIVKLELLQKYLNEAPLSDQDRIVETIFEDRKVVVDAWRAAGYHCCQVADGDY